MPTNSIQGKVIIVANGTFAHQRRLEEALAQADFVIAADGGANWLGQNTISPDLLIGDLDSIDSDLLALLQTQGCVIERHPVDKAETDTELALLAAVQRGAKEIILLGALGGRIDHELANIMLLTMPQLSSIRVSIFDGLSSLFVVRQEMTLWGAPGDLVSLIPLGGPALGITTEGLEYPLIDEPLWVGPARGVSNVMTDMRAHMHLRDGLLLLIHTPLVYLEAERDV